MSLIHDLSNITPLPEFDLFTLPPTQLTVERDVFTEHRPIAVLNSNSTIEFVVPTNYNEYIQLSETLLYMKLRVNLTKTDGSDVTEDDWKKIKPVNNLLHSLFKQVDLQLEGKAVTSAPQTYMYKAYFETMLGYTKDAKESHLSSVGYFEKEADRLALIKPKTITKDGSGKSFELMGKLHIDLAFQPKVLLGGTVLKVTLLPNDPNFYLICNDPKIIPKVVFENAALFIHRSKVYPAILEAHNLALERGTSKYPITRHHVKGFNINKDSMDIGIDNLVHGQLPRRMFVALVNNKAFNGDIGKDPFKFEHFDLSYLAAYIDGVQIPSKAYKPNFNEGLYLREYLGLFETLNQITTDSSITLTRDQWVNDNVIYGFNFAPDLASDCCQSGHISPIKRGVLRMEIRFSKPLVEPINVLVFFEFDNLIEIDKERNPFADFMQ